MKKEIKDAFNTIQLYSHMWNWCPDIVLAEEIYEQFPNSYSILTPFIYSLLEEIIRSTTSEYGRQLDGERKRVGMKLIKLAIDENQNNEEYLKYLIVIKKYFKGSSKFDEGDNRNSTLHGYMHPRFWTQESFENLLIDTSKISKFSGF